ncbi:class I SAM-dependent methyltransferase [Natronospora cellulosivora (SeqCode)]
MDKIKKEMRDRWNEKGWDYDKASAHGVHNHHAKNQWLNIFENLEKDRKSKYFKTLDVGTGTGFLALIMADLGYEVTAIDWSTTMLSQAEKKAEEKNFEIEFIEGQTEGLPFPTDSFQMLTARHVLWTLTEPAKALTEWYRVLEKDGIVLADFSPKSKVHNAKHYSKEIEEQLPLNKSIELEKLKELFEKAGFTYVSINKIKEETKHHQATYLIKAVK